PPGAFVMLNIPLKDYLRETRIFNARLGVAGVIVVVLTFILLARLVYLQVIDYRHYATLSQANRVKPVPIPPARGLILDRNGVVLAQNFPVYTLEIVPEQVKNMRGLLDELGKLVRVTDGDLKVFQKQLRERPRFEYMTLRSYLNEEEAARVAVRLPFLNGAELRARLQRHYPFGGLAVHALGYVSRISEQDLDRIDKSAYRGMQHIGKLGIEATYEELLFGRVGFEKVETNAHGRALRTLERIAPTAGKNLYLNIDAKAQAVAEQALGKRRGAVVAVSLKTKAVLAFASTPTYDANAFVNGIEPAAYKALLEDPDKPLINRVINGQYAPGSTIKAFLGFADLEAGNSIDMNRSVFCAGSYNLPGSAHQFRDWKKGGHGAVTLHDAIVQSCDVYFYRLAVALGPERMKNFLAPFGFGRATGVGRTSPYHIAGKTGTAQVKAVAQGARYDEHATPERFRDHALFVAFAPVEDPKVAVAVIVENGSHGSTTAAPIARQVLDQLILGGPADARKAAAVPPTPPKSVEDEEE